MHKLGSDTLALSSRDHAAGRPREGRLDLDGGESHLMFLLLVPDRTEQTNWVFNYLVGEITPELQDVITWRLYPMHGFFCVCSFVVGTLSIDLGGSTGSSGFSILLCVFR